MGAVARTGDILGRGGILTFPASPNVTCNGRPVALLGCIYTPHWGCPKDPRHCVGPTFTVPDGVTVNGLPPIQKGNGFGLCLEPVLTGSADVFIIGGALSQAVGLGLSAFRLASSLSEVKTSAPTTTPGVQVFDDGSLLQTFDDGSLLSIGTDGSLSSVAAPVENLLGGGEFGLGAIPPVVEGSALGVQLT